MLRTFLETGNEMKLFPLRNLTVWSALQTHKQNDLMVSQSAMTGIHSVCYQHSEEETPGLDQSWEWAASDCEGARQAFSTGNVAH